MQLNWVDVVILAVAAYYVFVGWETGFVYLLTNLVSFVSSLWLAVKYHKAAGSFLSEKFGVPSLWSTVRGTSPSLLFPRRYFWKF